MDFVANTVVRLRTCVVLLEMPQDSACMDSNKCNISYLLWPKWSQGQVKFESKGQIRSIFILLPCYMLCLYLATLCVLIVIIVICHYVCVNMCACEPVCI